MPPTLQSLEERCREEPLEGLGQAPSLQQWWCPSARDWGGMLGAMPGGDAGKGPQHSPCQQPRAPAGWLSPAAGSVAVDRRGWPRGSCHAEPGGRYVPVCR